MVRGEFCSELSLSNKECKAISCFERRDFNHERFEPGYRISHFQGLISYSWPWLLAIVDRET